MNTEQLLKEWTRYPKDFERDISGLDDNEIQELAEELSDKDFLSEIIKTKLIDKFISVNNFFVSYLEALSSKNLADELVLNYITNRTSQDLQKLIDFIKSNNVNKFKFVDHDRIFGLVAQLCKFDMMPLFDDSLFTEQIPDIYKVHYVAEISEVNDLLEHALEAIDNGSTVANIYIKNGPDDYSLLLSHGIIPYDLIAPEGIKEIKDVVSMLHDGYTTIDIAYWVDLNNQTVETIMKNTFLWSYITRSVAEEHAKLTDSVPLLYTFPRMLYSSKRPKTNMSVFQTPSSNFYSSVEEIPGNKIAVTRYSLGRHS